MFVAIIEQNEVIFVFQGPGLRCSKLSPCFTHTHTHTHTHAHTHMHACTHAHAHVHEHANAHVHMRYLRAAC